MIIVFDIGNSNVVASVYSFEWKEVLRVKTDTSKLYYDWFRDINYLTNEYYFDVTKVIISSVVPVLNEMFKKLIVDIFGIVPVLIDYKMYENLPIKVPQPRIIGTDIVANAVAAYERGHASCIIADFGTVLTFTTIFDNEIQGVTFVPGLNTALRSLSDKTAQLPYVKISVPKSVLGRNTNEAINSGVVFGYSGLVDRIIDKIKEETKREFKLLSTGGLGDIIIPLCHNQFEYDLHITVDGIRIIESYNSSVS